MSLWLDSYKARINAEGGTVSKSVNDSTKRTAKEQILNSPSRVDVKLNDDLVQLYPCIISDIETFKKRRFLFIPDTLISIGDYVHHNNFTYLATERTTDDKFPQLIGELCNSQFPIYSTVTKTPRLDADGKQMYDRYGKPLYDETLETVNKPCVVKSSYLQSSDTDQFMIPEGKITIILPYITPNNITLDYQFKMYDSDYRITNIDPTNIINGQGIYTVIAERVV